MNDTKAKSQFFDKILKRHAIYQAKYDIVSNKNSDEEHSHGSLTTGSSIEQSKAKIEKLKKQLMEEENNLLNLYKHKK
jgi:hypothetical protein